MGRTTVASEGGGRSGGRRRRGPRRRPLGGRGRRRAWNAGTNNMPAALHRDFVEIALSNALSEPGVDSGQAEPASAVATAR
jgi:hypothetical protein